MLSAVQTSVCVDASIDLFFSIFQHFSSSLEKTLELLWTAQDRKRHKKRRKERGISLSLRLACQVPLSLLRTHLLLPLWECATQTRRCLRPPLLRPSDADPPPRARRSQQIWRTKMSSRRVTSRNTIARRIVGSSCTIACTT